MYAVLASKSQTRKLKWRSALFTMGSSVIERTQLKVAERDLQAANDGKSD